MNAVLLKISLRNLIRQKRRNVLLGLGIAFGMGILVVANAFSHGISDILLNKIIVKITGHIIVARYEKDQKEWAIIRDKERMEDIIKANVADIDDVSENVGRFGRALGKGSADFMALMGAELNDEFYAETEVLEGDLHEMSNPELENPVAIYDRTAERLNVGIHDMIRMKFETIYGQVQTVRLTVVAILKSGNPFMSYASFTAVENLRPLIDSEEQEAETLIVTLKDLKNPSKVIEQADRLHAALQPNVAGYVGLVSANGQQVHAEVLSVGPETEAREAFAQQVTLLDGDLQEIFDDRHTALLSQSLAERLGVKVGDQIASTYQTRFDGVLPERLYRVAAIFEADEGLSDNLLFLHPEQFYDTFFPSVPQEQVRLDPQHVLFPSLMKEWKLLERSPDSDAYRQKHEELEDSGWRGALVEVQTMYEMASEVLKLERALDIATMVAVLILFFIILIGVINTLRMSIRERTREIGTVRAIGMQRWDVRWSFVLEVVFLAFFASLAGLGLGFLAMKLLGLITFSSEESFFMVFLVEKHLHFVPTAMDIVKNLGIILLIAFITAFFPAGRAAKMSVASALRHYE